MKSLRKTTGRVSAFLGLMGAVFVLAGCHGQSGPSFSDVPATGQAGSPRGNSSASAASAGSSGTVLVSATGNVFHVGDLVTVNFSGLSDQTAMPQHTEKVSEDGMINLDLIGRVKAAGKTAGQLQMDIQRLYVPKYFQNLTVTVVPPQQTFYVGGEVKTPGPKDYLGQTDIIQAIQAGGDFTDFANKKKVILTRANGQQVKVNVIKAIHNPRYDVPVYPGDTIVVQRRWW